jgi:glycosyltransferase involved in cell wall biosynthesis
VGNGILESELKKYASKNIVVLPFQNQSVMPIVYRLADIFVLPSKGPGETWGLAVNEAMACGKSVLVSDKVGCAVDLVKPNENGFVFKSEKLSDLIKKMISFKNKTSEFGKKSKEIIENWSFYKITNTIENTI